MKIEASAGKHQVDGGVELPAADCVVDEDHVVFVDAGVLWLKPVPVGGVVPVVPTKLLSERLLRRPIPAGLLRVNVVIAHRVYVTFAIVIRVTFAIVIRAFFLISLTGSSIPVIVIFWLWLVVRLFIIFTSVAIVTAVAVSTVNIDYD